MVGTDGKVLHLYGTVADQVTLNPLLFSLESFSTITLQMFGMRASAPQGSEVNTPFFFFHPPPIYLSGRLRSARPLRARSEPRSTLGSPPARAGLICC